MVFDQVGFKVGNFKAFRKLIVSAHACACAWCGASHGVHRWIQPAGLDAVLPGCAGVVAGRDPSRQGYAAHEAMTTAAR